MGKQTSYAKLQPSELTPDDELCRCLDMPPIKLMHALNENPIHCMNCNLEVIPETLALTERILEEISRWNNIYHAIYILWLDSGTYEAWAKEQLVDITSDVNVRGREVQRDLHKIRSCYYWYFQDESVDEFRLPGVNELIYRNPLLVTTITYLTLLFQGSYPFLIWNKRTKFIMLFGAICFHLGIAIVMGLAWFSLSILSVDVIFINDTMYKTIQYYLGKILQQGITFLRPRLRNASLYLRRDLKKV